jgi:hypothetical protein
MKHLALRSTLAVILIATAFAADKYDGPRPAKPDLPYLVHADNLIATELADATQEGKKDITDYTISGAGSPARTPLAEPIFIIQADKISPDRLELYRLEVKSGHRELQMNRSKRRNNKALHLQVTRLDGSLYKVEAGEPLENGQYALSPNDSNKVFCFEVF